MSSDPALLPDAALNRVLGFLPLQQLAVARSVCRTWRDNIDGSYQSARLSHDDPDMRRQADYIQILRRALKSRERKHLKLEVFYWDPKPYILRSISIDDTICLKCLITNHRQVTQQEAITALHKLRASTVHEIIIREATRSEVWVKKQQIYPLLRQPVTDSARFQISHRDTLFFHEMERTCSGRIPTFVGTRPPSGYKQYFGDNLVNISVDRSSYAVDDRYSDPK